MPVPFEWNFGPADAAIAAKPMQNGATVEANSRAIQGAIGGTPAKSAPDHLADGRNRTASARGRALSATQIRAPPDAPRMKCAIGIAPSHRGEAQAMGAPRLLPNFPATLDPKSGLNFAAFCQASSFLRVFSRHEANTRCERSHFKRQPRKNPGSNRDPVRMTAKICVL